MCESVYSVCEIYVYFSHLLKNSNGKIFFIYISSSYLDNFSPLFVLFVFIIFLCSCFFSDSFLVSVLVEVCVNYILYITIL